jgi:transcriptional regulator with XRE-family HTH domain
MGWESFEVGDLDPISQVGMETLGTLVRQWRVLCGLSQRELGERCLLSQSTISRLETGQLRGLRFRNLARLVGVLHDPLLGETRRSRSKWA